MWFAYMPGTPRDLHQPRPVIVLSADVRNQRRPDVIVAPVFSSGRLGPTRVAIEAGIGGLQRDGVVFCDQITTIDHQFLADGPLGDQIGSSILDRIIRAVRRALGEVVAEP